MASSQNSFAVIPELAARMPRIGKRWVWAWKVFYALKGFVRHLRITRTATWLLGPQYRRSRDMIEIDITYLCNLHCLNCNRSVTQARESQHMPLDMVRRFVNESIERGKRWKRIRVLGGEPTLHPEFRDIVAELRRYREWNVECIVEIATNGYGAKVNRELEALPPDVFVDNTAKAGPIQPHFGPFNLAPIDDPRYAFTDYKNACAIVRDCGMGLTPMGYYPCAVAGGIDRILGAELGQASLPDDSDDMLEAADRLCRLCGRFRDGHFVPRALRPVLDEEKISPTWQKMYAEWHEQKRVSLTVGGREVDGGGATEARCDTAKASR